MEVEALGAQAKRQDESGGGGVNKDEETMVTERDEGRSELRDPSALRVVIIINLSGV